MGPQCGYFQNYSDLLTLLQCQPVTNVTTVVQVHINFLFFFLNLSRKNRANRGRGKTEAKDVLKRMHSEERNVRTPIVIGIVIVVSSMRGVGRI